MTLRGRQDVSRRTGMYYVARRIYLVICLAPKVKAGFAHLFFNDYIRLKLRDAKEKSCLSHYSEKRKLSIFVLLHSYKPTCSLVEEYLTETANFHLTVAYLSKFFAFAS